MTRIVIADGNRQFRAALRRILDRDPELAVVGEAGNTIEALAVADAAGPEVVVMDLDLPGSGGVPTADMLRRRHRGLGVVLLSLVRPADEAQLGRLPQAEHVLKDVPAEEIIRAIKRHRAPALATRAPAEAAGA